MSSLLSVGSVSVSKRPDSKEEEQSVDVSLSTSELRVLKNTLKQLEEKKQQFVMKLSKTRVMRTQEQARKDNEVSIFLDNEIKNVKSQIAQGKSNVKA